MIILHSDDGKKGKFYVEGDSKIVGEMAYVWAGDKMIIEHTEVGEELKGQGAGKQLLAKAVNFARDKKVKILPLCPFARSVFDKTPDYNDVLF